MQDIVHWEYARRKYWNQHIPRISNKGLVRAMRDCDPEGSKLLGGGHTTTISYY